MDIGPIVAYLPPSAQRLIADDALTAAECEALGHMQDADGIIEVVVRGGDRPTLHTTAAYRAWLAGVKARIARDMP